MGMPFSTRARTLAASLALSASLLAPASLAGAANQFIGDGLVNVQVGDISVLDNADIAVAASVAATLCDVVDIGSIGVLAQQVDLTGKKATVCKTENGPVTIRKNR
jgi:hypothetical protein